MSRAQEMRGAAETRAAESRASESRATELSLSYQDYQPGAQFNLKVPGHRVRWVAEFVNGERMPNSIEDRLRQGYRPVRQSEIDDPYYRMAAEIMNLQQSDGFVRSGGLIAMAIPEEHAAHRDRVMQQHVDAINTATNALHGLRPDKSSGASLPTQIEANDLAVYTGTETAA